MNLHRKTLERSPWGNTITTQLVSNTFLSNSVEINATKYNTKLYEIIPKKFCEFNLILHKLYRVDKTIECVGDFIKKDRQDTQYLHYKKQLFNQTFYPYNKFPQLILDAWGKPILPKDYIELFGEFYNYQCLSTYLWCKEINKVKPCSSIKFFICVVQSEYRIFFIEKNIGLFDEVNPYWNVIEHTDLTFLKEQK